MRWLILGCGYVGTALARSLGHGTITRRDAAVATRLAADLGVTGVRADLADRASLAIPADVVVCLAPPGADPAGEIGNLAAVQPGRIVYVSSTGVYAPGGGALVDEAWPLEPTTASGRARLAAEQALPADRSIVLRAAGIYGPGRSIVDRIRDGKYRIIGDGTSHVSRIHVDDLVAAILAAARSTLVGAVNVADDDPAPIGEVADAIAAHLGVPPPPRVDPATVPPEVSGMLTADRRIANARLKDQLGVVLQHPSWRQLLA